MSFHLYLLITFGVSNLPRFLVFSILVVGDVEDYDVDIRNNVVNKCCK
jgi:hypothetical protein